MKIVYKILVFIFVMSGSVWFFSRDLSEKAAKDEKTVEMSDAQMPVLSIDVDGTMINTMHGYRLNLDVGSLRDSMTPMSQEQKLTVQIDEKESGVRKLAYELRSLDEGALLDSDSMLALETDEKNKCKTAQLKFQADLVSGKEYALKMMLVTNESKRIYYYTRIKYYEPDAFFKEKLDFVMKIHEMAWNKDKKNELMPYLETNSSMDNKSLALVNIHSSHALVCWGDLKPKLVGKIVPTLKELNIETAAFELSYRVKAKTPSGTEHFTVKEFFRVKYANQIYYLLNYQRTMEADFDINLTSLSKNELKFGITSEDTLNAMTSGNGGKVAFVRNRELWYYNLAENKAVQVFSFRKEDSEDERELYDQHNIRILSIDNDGNINFLVYGYMNRGSYEGKTAMVLYRFYAEKDCIEEHVYIPFEQSYERMKYDLDTFSYVSSHEIYYFSINNVAYAYNIPARSLEVLAENISSDNIYLSTEGSFIAWQNSKNPRKSNRITILDLETEQRRKITVEKNKCLMLLGGIKNKMIYGIMNKKDIAEAGDGTLVTPMYEICIVGAKKKTAKKYKAGRYYVTGVSIEDGIITLNRVVKRRNNGKMYYAPHAADHIINNQEEEKVYIGLNSRVTDLALTEYYVNLAQGYVLEELPEVNRASFTVLKEDSTLRLPTDSASERYYVYALGDVIAAYSKPSDAVNKADENMGVVLGSNGRIIWERGAKYNHNSIEGVHIVQKSGSIPSKTACLSMLLSASGTDVDTGKLSSGSKSMYSLFKQYASREPLNLTGCTLDAVLYYVSSGRPVIAMKNVSEAVLLIGYDEYSVTFIDPVTGKNAKYTIARAEKMFYDAGNVFMSYY